MLYTFKFHNWRVFMIFIPVLQHRQYYYILGKSFGSSSDNCLVIRPFPINSWLWLYSCYSVPGLIYTFLYLWNSLPMTNDPPIIIYNLIILKKYTRTIHIKWVTTDTSQYNFEYLWNLLPMTHDPPIIIYNLISF